MNDIDHYIPQMEPWFGDEERIALNDYMLSGGWLTEFRKTREFEEMIKKYTGSKYCIIVNNGTVSITLAALACGIRPGDEVIIPNYTMIATPNAVKLFGANPVFVDVEKETLCLDFEKLKKALSKKTKGIILVSANGRYPKSGIDNFINLALENNLILLEDSAQALGSFYPNGKAIGSVGKVGSFSFSVPKVISTGQGGAIITDDDSIAQNLKRLKDFGRERGGIDVHDSIGWNFKFTDLQAVIGIEQMRKLKWRVERKKEIYKRYQDNLKGLKQVTFFEQELNNTTPWFIDVLVDERESLISYLNDHKIGTRPMYPPINKQKAYQIAGEFSVSNMVGSKGLWLPSASQLSNNDIDKITTNIIKYYS